VARNHRELRIRGVGADRQDRIRVGPDMVNISNVGGVTGPGEGQGCSGWHTDCKGLQNVYRIQPTPRADIEF